MLKVLELEGLIKKSMFISIKKKSQSELYFPGFESIIQSICSFI